MKDQRRPDDPWWRRAMWAPWSIPAAIALGLVLGAVIAGVAWAFGAEMVWA